MTLLARALIATLALAASLAAAAADPKPYPGTLTLSVDATDLDHRILRVRERVPAAAGKLKLYFPRWLPGHHAPAGDVAEVAGLVVRAGDRRVDWRRDPLDTHAFDVDVPRGVDALDLEFQNLTPPAGDAGRVVMTPAMLNLQWNEVVLYPAGYDARAIRVDASLKLPAGWRHATALRPAAEAGAAEVTRYQTVSLETLVDSPVFAGRYFKRIDLDPPGHERPIALNLFADREDQLAASDEQIEAHRRLVQQADKLFASRHYAHYDLLLALSDVQGGIGLEHHQSSENGVKPDYFKDWDKQVGPRTLLPHEYTHSWNGKFRRPADLWTPNFNVPMQDSLLWVYEGQTQYWGELLAVRSGLVKPELMHDQLAQMAAWSSHRAGRAWRNLQDTTNEPILGARSWRRDWIDWQRSADYYDESALVWLDADTLIREKSGGQRSLDDFARAFFGVRNGETGPLTYRFDDVVAALQAVQPNDWAGFLRERLDSHDRAPLDGLARAGWRLAYAETPSDNWKAGEAVEKEANFAYSIGLVVAEDGKLKSVSWDGPAYAAGVRPTATLVAVNLRAYKPDELQRAITANKDGAAPIELLLREDDAYRQVRIDYRGGLRYPKLERIDGTPDRLAETLAPR